MAHFRGLQKTCLVCAAPFRVSPSLARVQTCSRECGYKARVVANKKPPVTLTCAHCTKVFTERPCHAERRVHCSKECAQFSVARAESCAKNVGEKNPGWKGGVTFKCLSKSGREYSRSVSYIETEKNARRRQAKDRATPPWADLDQIRAFYKQAAELTDSTGTPHHVDHIVPLRGRRVSGLHNQFNLQVLSAEANLKKHNRFVI